MVGLAGKGIRVREAVPFGSECSSSVELMDSGSSFEVVYSAISRSSMLVVLQLLRCAYRWANLRGGTMLSAGWMGCYQGSGHRLL